MLLCLFYVVYTGDLKVAELKEYKRQIIVYSDATCPYCINTRTLLKKNRISYTEHDITWDKEWRQQLISETGKQFAPYIYINDKFIGGFDEIKDLIKTHTINDLIK